MTDARQFSVWDYVVFAAMLLASAAIGVYAALTGGRQRTADEFLLGDRKVNILPVALSMTVSFISAISVIGSPGDVYVYNIMYGWVAVTLCIGSFLAIRWFLPIYMRLNVTSIYEYLDMRFNRAMRLSASLLYSLQLLLYMGIVLYTPATALNAVTGMDLWTAVMSTGAVCIFYSTVGGIKAVLWADSLQALVIVGGLIAIIVKGTIDVGGVDEVIRRGVEGNRIYFTEMNPDPRITYSVWTMLFGNTFLQLSFYTNQMVAQRLLACGSKKKAKQAIGIFNISYAFIVSLCVVSGLVMYAYYKDCDPLTQGVVSNRDQLMPLFVMDIFADIPGVPGLFLAAVLSASISTMSSGINSLAAVTGEDFIKSIWTDMKPSTYVWVSKGLALCYGILTMGTAYLASLMGSGVLQLAVSLTGIVGGSLIGVFLLGVYVHRSNSAGAIAGFFTGVILLSWIKIGSILYPTDGGQNVLSTDNCPDLNTTDRAWTSSSLVTEYSTTPTVGEESRAGITDLYALSSYAYPTIGLIVCFGVGVLVSAIT
ncbi:sodium-coupled monocarboxylate transporter 2-like, partial [Diadema antillarum]|uniref:sodium-coupled monocarboxylate transporter 2-like n=1 Tax=Diadema antillarum TaxID=105358 RepID=UPI003A87785C